MKTGTFTIKYQAQTLQVEKASDVNGQVFYKVILPDDKNLELYITPELDGMPPIWAEGTGEKTDRAREIGGLIEGNKM